MRWRQGVARAHLLRAKDLPVIRTMSKPKTHFLMSIHHHFTFDLKITFYQMKLID